MIAEMQKLLSRNEDIDEAALKEAAYHLLARQFLLRAKPRHRRHYETIVRFSRYYQNLMDAFNHRLIIDENRGYAGILPLDFTWRMSLLETLVLLSLRYLYDEAVNNFAANGDGTVEISVVDFEMRFQHFAKRDLPQNKGDFAELIAPFVRFGVLEYGPDADRPEIDRLRILPTITTLLDADAVGLIENYLKAEDVDTSAEDAEEAEAP